jgi:hypothetical protein
LEVVSGLRFTFAPLRLCVRFFCASAPLCSLRIGKYINKKNSLQIQHAGFCK